MDARRREPPGKGAFRTFPFDGRMVLAHATGAWVTLADRLTQVGKQHFNRKGHGKTDSACL